MINLKINNVPVQVENGTTILEAAKKVGIKIPTLCFLKEINEIGACRICVVEVKGMANLVASCVYPVFEGMEVYTNSEKVLKARKTTLELILSNHRKDCLSCDRNTNCELQSLAYEYGCDANRFAGAMSEEPQDFSTEYIVRDNTKCILCRRCVAVCKKTQGIGVIGANERGFNTHVGCAFDMGLANTPCVGCGQCVTVCPTGALTEKSELTRVKQALSSGKHVVVGSAPSVRVALGEEFGLPVGTNVEGKMVTALRLCGFKNVFDVNCSADFTIMEEATELLERIQNGGKLPMFTSCCPGWISYMEHNYGDLLGHLSSCKSPQNMFGALIKHVYAKQKGIDPKDVFVVTIMPCTAKKGEKLRTFTDGIVDVDAVLTTRELARLIKNNGLDFANLAEGRLDSPFGDYTGAALIFGATGGVMEAALRTAVEKLGGDASKQLDFVEVRGQEGVKVATYDVNGVAVKVAVVNGIKQAKEICDLVRQGKADYHFVEVMTCPGGCVNGGGQPINANHVGNRQEITAKRAGALYVGDKNMKNRTSHTNASVLKIYEDCLGEPNGHLAHKLLHTSYKPQPLYKKD